MKKIWEKWKKSKKCKIVTAVIIAAVAISGVCLKMGVGNVSILDDDTPLSVGTGPMIYYEQADMVRGQEVMIDVKLTGLKGNYPAASFQIDFDRNKLEFLEIRQGNIEIQNVKTGETLIPEWSFSPESANNKGSIKTMYLDMTGEENPISGSLLNGDKDVLFRLVFRVKDSCNEGETLNLVTKQATFAAVDESQSLAVNKENIAAPNGVFNVTIP